MFASFNSRKEFFISLGLSSELNVQRIQGMAILIMPNYTDSPSLVLNNPTKRALSQWLGNCSPPHAHVTQELCFDVIAKWLRMQEQIL